MPTRLSQLPLDPSWIRRRLDGHDRALRELRAAGGVRTSLGNATSLQGVPVSGGAPTGAQVLTYVDADGMWEPADLLQLDAVHVPGLAADGVHDDAPAIQAVLDTLDARGSHSYEVVVEGPAGATVYINSTVQISTSRVTLRFGSPVLFGPLGRVRIFGELEETPPFDKPMLTADATVGSTTIDVDDPSPFSVGDYIVIRGEHDASGGTLQRMYNVVTAISGSTLTLADPLDDTYLISYPSSDWPGDETRITRTTSSMLSVDAARGDRTVTITATAQFAVGDWVQVLDDSLTHDDDGSEQPSDYTHREITQVAEIVSGTVLRLTGALHHPYVTAERARVAKILPVIRSHIRDAVVSWSAASTVSNAFEIQYGVSCTIRDCVAAGGSSGSWRNQAFRLSNAWGCTVADCTAYGPQDTSSGRGYGATLYGATACVVRGLHAVALRHSVLFFNGACGNVVSNCLSQDVRISDYDLHGAECVDNLITGCVAVGGDSLPTDEPSGVRKAACKAGNPSHIEGDSWNTFDGMLIVNYGFNTGGGSALDVVAQSANTVLRNSRILNAATGITIVEANDDTLIATDTRVLDCEFEDVATLANVDGGSNRIVDGLAIEGCRFVRATGTLRIERSDRVAIRNCTWIDPNQGATTYAVTGEDVEHFAIRGNDLSGCYRGVKLTTCPSARISGNALHDLVDTTVYEDAGGNTGTLFRGNDAFGYVPFFRTSGSGPSVGSLVDIHQPYQDDLPSDRGWAEWNHPPKSITSGAGQILVSGTVYVQRIAARTGGNVSNAKLTVGTLGTSITNAWIAVFDSAGTRLAISADQASSWTSAGNKTISLGTTLNLIGGRDYYFAILAVGSGMPAIVRGPTSVVTPNFDLSNAVQWYSTNGTGQTSMPSSLTLSSNSGTGAIGFTVGLA